MFTIERRQQIQDALVTMARADESVTGAAFVGSSASGHQDAWSDIDLMLQLSPDADVSEVIEEWTTRLYHDIAVAHHLDVRAGNGVLYRVFLTAESLQMDISFWPHNEFRAIGDRFRLLFGEPNEPEQATPEEEEVLIGQAWLFAVHVRSALARNQPWFALSLMDTMRDRIIMLASIRCGLNPHQRREVDMLPEALLEKLGEARANSLEINELQRSFTALLDMLQVEIEAFDGSLAERLSTPLNAMLV